MGAFFISTGEILMPRFSIDDKQSGEILTVEELGIAKLVNSVSLVLE